ncbi:CRISPR-associated protein Cas4 [uncultured Anaerofustis sp.]|uniref:CRISPR-associated protein Cas4 n=1 Tax=uncultured Anaerofustis sp. TaxID=904996 RepID=UPI0025D56D43|nr:CRISPR-associated protein Cas4 [uncultured Anaerofustis sp.]
MTTDYNNEHNIPISMIKQYAYCPHRFSLMYLDNVWSENYKIVEGNITHRKVDNPFIKEKRKDTFYSRSVPVYSDELDLYGIVDIIEFTKSEDDSAVKVKGKRGKWKINPIEYKNGKKEKSNADALQLCAQAICLEEMFDTKIEFGEIFYNKIKRRFKVEFDNKLRSEVLNIIGLINENISKNEIIPIREEQNCNLCSIRDNCLPFAYRNKNSKEKLIELIKRNDL